jgi:hypothetical protein
MRSSSRSFFLLSVLQMNCAKLQRCALISGTGCIGHRATLAGPVCLHRSSYFRRAGQRTMPLVLSAIGRDCLRPPTIQMSLCVAIIIILVACLVRKVCSVL